ncbi:hypothetical protein N2152v2_006706 [Parachlorella kessleri]
MSSAHNGGSSDARDHEGDMVVSLGGDSNAAGLVRDDNETGSGGVPEHDPATAAFAATAVPASATAASTDAMEAGMPQRAPLSRPEGVSLGGNPGVSGLLRSGNGAGNYGDPESGVTAAPFSMAAVPASATAASMDAM